MYNEIGPLEYSNKVLEKMRPGIFLTTKSKGVINTMIIGWGGINMIWGKPIFMVLVRESRATFDLIEDSNEFTVSVPFDNQLNGAIKICGTKSLRDMNKFEYCNLTPIPGRVIDTPIIGEAKLHYECKVLYKHKLDKDMLPNEINESHYDKKDGSYHTIYYGEIMDQYLYEKE